MPVTNKEGTTRTSIFHCNVRSIRKNVNLLVSFLAQQEQIFDIVATTETWLKPGENITIPGYTLMSNARVSRSRGGGVALFIKKERSFSILSGVTCSTPFIESLSVMLESSLIVGVVYRPPIEFSNFINALTGALAKSSQNVSPRSRDMPVCPWMNKTTLEAIKTKDYWYYKWRHNRKNQYYFIQFKASGINWWQC